MFCVILEIFLLKKYKYFKKIKMSRQLFLNGSPRQRRGKGHTKLIQGSQMAPEPHFGHQIILNGLVKVLI